MIAESIIESAFFQHCMNKSITVNKGQFKEHASRYKLKSVNVFIQNITLQHESEFVLNEKKIKVRLEIQYISKEIR